jgi:MSHA biogenesis protein MshJ
VSVWKHGVEIRLKGSYVDLGAYLSELERLPQRLIWGEIRLQADYPNSEILLRIYTYSLDQAWLKL